MPMYTYRCDLCNEIEERQFSMLGVPKTINIVCHDGEHVDREDIASHEVFEYAWATLVQVLLPTITTFSQNDAHSHKERKRMKPVRPRGV